MRKNKYRRGERVAFMIDEMLKGERSLFKGQWFYFNHKPLHPSFILGWSIRQLYYAVAHGRIYFAEENKESDE